MTRSRVLAILPGLLLLAACSSSGPSLTPDGGSAGASTDVTAEATIGTHPASIPAAPSTSPAPSAAPAPPTATPAPVPIPTPPPASAPSACWVVNTTTRTAHLDLADAIARAPEGTTLTVQGICRGAVASPARPAVFVIDRSITLQGVRTPDSGIPGLDAGQRGAVVWVTEGASVRLVGLAIVNGVRNGAHGGGLYNEGGTVTLEDVTVAKNRAAYGAGIANAGGSVTLVGSTVFGNAATVSGGGVWNVGRLVSRGSTIRDNTASVDGGGILSYGDPYYSRSTVQLDIADSTVAGNRAGQPGGGIANGCSDADVGVSVMALARSTVRANVSGTYGGGISNCGAGSITDSTVAENRASWWGGGIANYGGPGTGAGDLTIHGSTINGNAAGGRGGGIASTVTPAGVPHLSVSGSSIVDNSATQGGGGIFNEGADAGQAQLTIVASSVSGNHTAAEGGGILNTGVLTFTAPASRVGENGANGTGGILIDAAGEATGACPTALEGYVDYDPANSVPDFRGFSCGMPLPELVLTGTHDGTAGDPPTVFTYYQLSIANSADFAPELFTPAPDLPACGLNTSSSRTWVEIYDAGTGARLYGFCAFTDPSWLTKLWFARPKGTPPPATVFVTLIDRRTGDVATSNTISIPTPTP